MPQKSDHRCPFCFAALPQGGAIVACPVGKLDSGKPCRGAEPRQGAGQCPDHKVALVDHCYVPGCRRQLPGRWSEVTTTCIAMAGTRDSGKTVFIKVAADLLRSWGRGNHLSISHYSPKTRRDYEERFGEFAANAKLFASTEPEVPGRRTREQQEPVFLRIQRPGVPDHILVLRDVAGEDVQNAEMDRNHFRFLANADGVILLVDPSDSPQVRRAGIVDQEISGFDPAAVWGNLESLHAAVVGTNSPPVPLAVTVSKFDLVMAAAASKNSELTQALASRGGRMHQDPSLRTGTFDAMDADLLDSELRSLCDKRYLGHPLLVRRAHDVARRGGQVRFFAVSSLGKSPKLGKVAAHGTVPYRVLDPVKWFLANASVL